MERRGERMVGWYNPAQLLRTAIDIVVAKLLHGHADTRLLKIQTGPEPSFVEGKDAVGDGFWFDYVADTGDGFAPTFAIARLLSCDALTVGFALNLFGSHPNEAFTALRIQRYKHFLRCCITVDGALEVNVVGLDRPAGEAHLVDTFTIPAR